MEFESVIVALCLCLALVRVDAASVAVGDENSMDEPSPPEVLEWSACSSVNAVELSHLSISPLPIEFPGVLNVSMHGESLHKLEGNIDLKVHIIKHTMLGDWEIPCLLNFGSCTYHDLCSKISAADNDEFLQEATKLINAGTGGVPFECPFEPHHLQVDNHQFVLPEVPSAIMGIIEGAYTIKIELVQHGGSVLGCFQMKPELRKKPCTGSFWQCLW